MFFETFFLYVFTVLTPFFRRLQTSVQNFKKFDLIWKIRSFLLNGNKKKICGESHLTKIISKYWNILRWFLWDDFHHKFFFSIENPNLGFFGKFRSFLLDGISSKLSFPSKKWRHFFALPYFGDEKDTTSLKKKFPLRRNINLEKFPIIQF